MIGLLDYCGEWFECPDFTVERKEAAIMLLAKVNGLLEEYEANGGELRTNPATGTYVSGERYGGFRPQSCTQGATHSAHKEARAVDVFDPDGSLDMWLTDGRLEAHGLYREAPGATKTWCHLTDRAPPSKRRTFQP